MYNTSAWTPVAMANVKTSTRLSFKEYEPCAVVVTKKYHLNHFHAYELVISTTNISIYVGIKSYTSRTLGFLNCIADDK